MNKTQKSDSVNRAANDTVARTSRSHFRLSVGRLIFCAVVLAASNALLADTPAPKSASQGDTANIPHSSPLAPVPSSFNWRAWEELPVFHDGRVMPLVTFARITVKTVCGRNSPTLELDTGIIEEAQRDGLLGEREIARLHAKFADGKRKFRDAELIFSWLVEPEIWEYIPFLAASDRELRSEVAAQPAMGKYVSPYQVKKHAVNVQRRIDQWEKVQANQLDDREIEKLGADGLASLRTVGPAAVKLHESYRAYRSLINEANALPVYQLSLTLSQAERQMQNAYRMQLTLERVPVDFSQLGEPIPFVRGELNTLYQDINELAVNVQRAMRNEAAKPVTHQTLEADFERLLVEIDRLLPETVRFRDAMFTLRLDTIPRQVGVNAERLRMARELAAQMQYSLLQSRQWCESACLSLHDAGGSAARPHTMQIYPALVAESIKTDRSYPMQSRDMFSQNREYSETTRMPVWLTLHTLLFGSDDMIRRFAIPDLPEEERGAGGEGRGIRSTFYEMKAAYLSLESPETGATDRKEQIAHFNRASLEFAVELRASAEAVAQLRRDLVPPELRDNDLLTKTAYPAQSLMRAEYNYECLRPFYLMWVTSAAALALLLASAVASLFRAERAKDAEMYNPSVLDAGRNSSANSARKSYRIVEATLFWCGFAMLLVSQLVTLTGACYRAYITGWAPVTNMFETIVLMAFSVAAIGIWFTCKPLFGDRLLCAWRVAALPKGTSQRTSTAQSSSDTSKIERRFVLWQLILLPIRVVLAIVTLYYILLLSYGEASGGQLTWEVVRQGIAIKDPIDLTVVVVSIALLVWLVPRVILTLTLFPFVGASGFRLQTSG
ncbi:MAG: hypothetical protein FWH27_07185, partial [Planctomycetaceae bacterium]|nr:hypothetical protein [Planctomycetaceae bacterium]